LHAQGDIILPTHFHEEPILINVPHDLDYRKDEFEFEKRTSIKFYDEDPRDKSDVFEIEMPIAGLIVLVKKFHGLVNAGRHETGLASGCSGSPINPAPGEPYR
jgi:hypothetical protein